MLRCGMLPRFVMECARERAFTFQRGSCRVARTGCCAGRSPMLEWGGARASVMEVSHRGQDFVEWRGGREQALRRLHPYRQLPGAGSPGGATQISPDPMTSRSTLRTDYIVTGALVRESSRGSAQVWPGRVVAAASTMPSQHPDLASAEFDTGRGVVHYTPNETIHGVEFHQIPMSELPPLVADASSTPVAAARRFALRAIDAGAQRTSGLPGWYC